MAIGKWISFSQPVHNVQDIPQPIPIPCTADGKRFGLENFGNTCYANSVLQALYFCSPFRELVIHHPDPYPSLHNGLSTRFPPTHSPTSPTTAARRKPDRKSTQDSPPQNAASHLPTHSTPSAPRTLFAALRALYLHISQNSNDKGTIPPRAFIEKLRELNEGFRNTMHHDAHEFLNYLLNRIVEEIDEEKKQRLASGDDLPRSMNSSSTASHPPAMTASASSSSAPSPGATFIHQIFEGTLTSETRCLTCENVSSRDESFLDLSIDIDQNSSVTACLRQFSASEMLCQKEKFFCDACCDLQEAERRMKIKRLPNVLALHLKRFKYQEDVQKFIKLTYRVAFPFELRLFNTVDDIPNPDRLYQLFAIVVHIGNGPNHGHYVSIIKTMGTWLIFDDETVDTIKECDITKYFGDSNSGSAYVLYYQAVDVDLAALGLRPPSPEPVIQAVPQSESSRDWQPTDSPVLSSQSIPPLLPDLADDLPSHATVPDAPPRPTTPPNPILAPPEPPSKSPRKVPSQFLRVALGSHRSSTIGHAASRNEASLRPLRSTFDEKPSSAAKPSLSPITTFPKEDLKPVDGHSANAVNGKDKDSDKSMMSWLRRRSFKNAKSRPSSDASVDVPQLPQTVVAAPGSPAYHQSTSSSSNSSKDSRLPLDSPTSGQLFPRTPPLPNGKPPHITRTTDASPCETDSKHSSASASFYTDSTSPGGRSQSRPLPPIPASPQTPNGESLPPHSSTSLDPSRSPRRHAMSPTYNSHFPIPPPRSPARPATSAGTPTKTHVPPLPIGNLQIPKPSIATGRVESRSRSDITVERPKSAHASYGPTLSPLVTRAPPLPPVPVPASNPRKPAARKLSLTAPRLGFGKRDKDKH